MQVRSGRKMRCLDKGERISMQAEELGSVVERDSWR